MFKNRFGVDKTWTGNDIDVLELLFTETCIDNMSREAMNILAEDYAGSTRFKDRMKNFKVLRWKTKGKKLTTKSCAGRIPFDDMLNDWMEIGLVSDKVVDDSLTIRKYENAIEQDVTAKKARLEMAAKLCVDIATEDAIFNGLKGPFLHME
tara:strand:- start:1353 stop:1805 length:453 start_codon:yes stop_codon:yes gene_type:complete